MARCEPHSPVAEHYFVLQDRELVGVEFPETRQKVYIYTDGSLLCLVAFASAASRAAKNTVYGERLCLQKRERRDRDRARSNGVGSSQWNSARRASTQEISKVAGAGHVAEWLVNCCLLYESDDWWPSSRANNGSVHTHRTPYFDRDNGISAARNVCEPRETGAVDRPLGNKE